MGIVVCSVPFLLFPGATGLVFRVLITGYGAFYNHNILDLAPREETEKLVGSIVEDV